MPRIISNLHVSNPSLFGLDLNEFSPAAVECDACSLAVAHLMPQNMARSTLRPVLISDA